ncbi:hypothetical protein MHK_000554 [Candidatus Magnetomorum sp. HK-1]|nr:hypothetical protein MHK_000554 [Candidatus Magnetomorum sp. HK-1]
MATINDVVMIYFEDNPVAFARIEDISPDHKKDWYHVTLLMLQLPLQTVTWILRDIYIEGETFTMNGKKMRLEEVKSPETSVESENDDDAVVSIPEPKKRPNNKPGKPGKGAKVVSLKDRMKR